MFGFLVNIFNTFLYYPLFNLLVFIYNILPVNDFGLAIIGVTLIIRLVLYPLSVKALQSQRAMQKIQPQLQEIQKKHKDDKEKQTRAMLDLYRSEKVNPFSGLLLVLAQLPILIALYNVFWRGLRTGELQNLYGFVANPQAINPIFLGAIDLSQPNLLFALLAGVIQFLQTKMLMPKKDALKPKDKSLGAMMQGQMTYLFSFITVVILLKLPSALGLYWVASGIFSIVQQHLIFRKMK